MEQMRPSQLGTLGAAAIAAVAAGCDVADFRLPPDVSCAACQGADAGQPQQDAGVEADQQSGGEEPGFDLATVECDENGVPLDGTELPKSLVVFSDSNGEVARMFLGDKDGDGMLGYDNDGNPVKMQEAPEVAEPGKKAFKLTEEMANLPDPHSKDGTLVKEAGGGVLWHFIPGDTGERARWAQSVEKGNPANVTFAWPVEVFLQNEDKLSKTQEEKRQLFIELAAALKTRQSNAEKYQAVLEKFGLSSVYTTSGTDTNDMSRMKVQKGKGVVIFMEVPVCEGVDVTQEDTRDGIGNVFEMDEGPIDEGPEESKFEEVA